MKLLGIKFTVLQQLAHSAFILPKDPNCVMLLKDLSSFRWPICSPTPDRLPVFD